MADIGLVKRPLERTGTPVTRIGYGAMSLYSGRFVPVSPEPARAVVNALLDIGINFVGATPDYRESVAPHFRKIRWGVPEKLVGTSRRPGYRGMTPA